MTAPETATCAVCESPVSTADWHPAAAEIIDGTVCVQEFCSDDCRAQWLGDIDEPAAIEH